MNGKHTIIKGYLNLYFFQLHTEIPKSIKITMTRLENVKFDLDLLS